MTAAQEALTIQDLFLPQAEAEVKERKTKRSGLGTSPIMVGDVLALQIAVDRSGMEGISVRSMQRMQSVRHALQT